MILKQSELWESHVSYGAPGEPPFKSHPEKPSERPLRLRTFSVPVWVIFFLPFSSTRRHFLPCVFPFSTLVSTAPFLLIQTSLPYAPFLWLPSIDVAFVSSAIRCVLAVLCWTRTSLWGLLDPSHTVSALFRSESNPNHTLLTEIPLT